MNIDKDRKLAFLSRDPRAFGNSQAVPSRRPVGLLHHRHRRPDRSRGAALPGRRRRPHQHLRQRAATASGAAARRVRPTTRRTGSRVRSIVTDVSGVGRDAAGNVDRARHASAPTRSRSTPAATAASPTTRTTSRSTSRASPGSPAAAASVATGPRASTSTRPPGRHGRRPRRTPSRTPVARSASTTTPPWSTGRPGAADPRCGRDPQLGASGRRSSTATRPGPTPSVRVVPTRTTVRTCPTGTPRVSCST